MRDYFQRRYSPGNIVVVAAGRVDFDELVRTANTLCGGWQPIEAGRSTTPAPCRIAVCNACSRTSAALEYVLQLAVGPSATDPRPLRSQNPGDDPGRRFGQPALLGAGRLADWPSRHR